MLTALLLAAVLWVVLGAALWIAQERLIFLRDGRGLAASGPFALEEVTTADGLRLRFLAAPPAAPGTALVLLFQGNGGNAGDRVPALLPVVVAQAGATAPSSSAPLEIVLPDGAVVRVPPSFDEATLARVVRALGGAR